MTRRQLLEILRIAGQPVKANDRQPGLPARAGIIAGEEGQPVARRPAPFREVTDSVMGPAVSGLAGRSASKIRN